MGNGVAADPELIPPNDAVCRVALRRSAPHDITVAERRAYQLQVGLVPAEPQHALLRRGCQPLHEKLRGGSVSLRCAMRHSHHPHMPRPRWRRRRAQLRRRRLRIRHCSALSAAVGSARVLYLRVIRRRAQAHAHRLARRSILSRVTGVREQALCGRRCGVALSWRCRGGDFLQRLSEAHGTRR